MPVFVTYLPYQTFSLLVAGNSYENVSRVGSINNFDLEAAFGKIIYIQILVKIIVIFLLRCLKALLPKFQSFPRRLSVVCFLSRAITLEPICESFFFPLACPANSSLLELT